MRSGGAVASKAWEWGGGKEEVLPGVSGSSLCFGDLPLVVVLMKHALACLPRAFNFLLKWGRCICLHGYTDWQLREAGRVQKHHCPIPSGSCLSFEPLLTQWPRVTVTVGIKEKLEGALGLGCPSWRGREGHRDGDTGLLTRPQRMPTTPILIPASQAATLLPSFPESEV